MKEGKQTSNYPHVVKPWMKYYEGIPVYKNYDKNHPEGYQTNLADYVYQKNKNHLNSVAETYYGNKITYGEYFERVEQYSKALASIGVGKGSRILYLVPNIPESGMLWLASSQIGAISDFVDPRPDSPNIEANANKLLEIIKFEGADYIVALDKCYLAMIRPIEHSLKDLGIQNIVTISATDSMTLPGKIDYLREVIAYNHLRNIRISDETIQKLTTYQVLSEKLKAMKRESEAYKIAAQTSPLEVKKLSELLKNSQYVSLKKVYDEDAISYIGHTSGTSGARPKPIPLTNANQISGTEQIFKADANFKRGDRVLHELPFFSPLGSDNNYILNLASGANNIDIPEFEISEFGYLISKYKPNVILGTPAWLASLPDCRYLDKMDLSCITRIIYGGDSMTRQDEEKLDNWLRLHGSSAMVEKGHGMSEYCGCGSYAQKEWNDYESIGIPLPDTIYAVVKPGVEDHLEPVEWEEGKPYLEGELAVSSPAVTGGVLDGKVIVPHYELDGNSYIRTRDLVKMRPDGLFIFEARKDRSFTRFDGYKVKPHEIERVIEENPNVKYCRIVPYQDDKKRGLMPIAHIVLEDSSSITDPVKVVEDIVYNQIIQNPNMSSRQIPSKFQIRDSLPLSKNSKINFNALIEEGTGNANVNVDVDETNLSVGDIHIYPISKGKVKKLVL